MAQTFPIATTPSGQTQRGHLQAMRQDMIGYLEHLSQQGDFLRVPLGLGSAYFVNRAEWVQEVLLKQARKFQKPFTVKYTARGLFGENLFTSDGELWQALRNTLQPGFHAQRLNDYASLMTEYTQAMLTQWRSGQTIDVPDAMMDLTLGITTKAFFGEEMRDATAAQGIVRFIELFSRRVSGLPIPLWLPIPSNWELKRLIAIGDQYLGRLITERRQSGKDQGDILSMLLQAQAADPTGLLTDQQVRNEVLNLFAAGYEVTAHTLAFTLYLISQHPEVETRLLEEIDRVLDQRPITVSDLSQMPYLEMVLRESMRLLPVTTVLSRQATEKVTIDRRTIPRNSAIFISPWTLHRRSDYFPDPLRFDPERFRADRKNNIPKFAYLPFSAGPRICIGNAFAMMQMQINLAIMLQQYRFTVPADYQFQPVFSFNTRPKGGLPMRVSKRTESEDG